MITIRGKQYHMCSIIENKNPAENPDCVGCAFQYEDHEFCEQLMDDVPDDMGCAYVPCIYVLDDPEHIARYTAFRLGAKDEP